MDCWFTHFDKNGALTNWKEKNFCIRETHNLSTGVDSSTDAKKSKNLIEFKEEALQVEISSPEDMFQLPKTLFPLILSFFVAHVTRKMAEKSTQLWLKHVLYKKLSESAESVTFVTKDQIKK